MIPLPLTLISPRSFTVPEKNNFTYCTLAFWCILARFGSVTDNRLFGVGENGLLSSLLFISNSWFWEKSFSVFVCMLSDLNIVQFSLIFESLFLFVCLELAKRSLKVADAAVAAKQESSYAWADSFKYRICRIKVLVVNFPFIIVDVPRSPAFACVCVW